MTEDNSTAPTRKEPTPAELKEWERLYGDRFPEPGFLDPERVAERKAILLAADKKAKMLAAERKAK